MSPTFSFKSLPYPPARLITLVGSSVCTWTLTSSGSPTTRTELPSDSIWPRISSVSRLLPSMRNSVQYPQPPSGSASETWDAGDAVRLVSARMVVDGSLSSMVLSMPSRMSWSP